MVSSTSPTCTFFSSPCNPSTFSPSTYAAEIIAEETIANQTTFALAYSPCNKYLLAGTSNGRMNVFNLAAYLSSSSTSFSSDHCSKSRRKLTPIVSFSVHPHNLNVYDIKLIPVSNTHRLLCAGDAGVLVYAWNDVLDGIDKALQVNEHLLTSNSSTPTATTTTMKAQPIPLLHTFLPHPSINEPAGVEFNSLSYLPSTNTLYAAGGDRFGGYSWDFETGLLRGNLVGHKEYLHSVVAVEEGNLVLTAGEDGYVTFWDSKSAKLIQQLDIKASILPSNAQNNANSKLWVSAQDVDSHGNFAAIAGGIEGRGGEKGWAGLVHLPTRTITNTTLTPSSLQVVKYHASTIIAAGNSPHVSHLTRSSLSPINNVSVNASSVFGVGINKRYGVYVVAGTNGVMDCFESAGMRKAFEIYSS